MPVDELDVSLDDQVRYEMVAGVLDFLRHFHGRLPPQMTSACLSVLDEEMNFAHGSKPLSVPFPRD